MLEEGESREEPEGKRSSNEVCEDEPTERSTLAKRLARQRNTKRLSQTRRPFLQLSARQSANARRRSFRACGRRR